MADHLCTGCDRDSLYAIGRIGSSRAGSSIESVERIRIEQVSNTIIIVRGGNSKSDGWVVSISKNKTIVSLIFGI